MAVTWPATAPERCATSPGFTMPRVLNKHRDAIPADAIYVGRGSAWGNPYKITATMTRDMVCDAYERHCIPQLDLAPLRGHDLVCFCAPHRCHADALLVAANK